MSVLWPLLGAALIVLLVAGDLLLAARALPHTHPTAPQAVWPWIGVHWPGNQTIASTLN